MTKFWQCNKLMKRAQIGIRQINLFEHNKFVAKWIMGQIISIKLSIF